MQIDIAVIGGGPGGYGAAIRAAQLGYQAVVIEREHLGGVCLNWGCIPSKALLHAAEVLDTVRNAKGLGITYENLAWDFNKVVAHSRGIVAKQTKGLQFLMRKHGVEIISGTANFVNSKTLGVQKLDGSALEVTASDIVIAAGGRARLLPNLPFDGTSILSARDALGLTNLPERAVIVGGGAVGVEFACIWHAFGVQVTLVEFAQRLLPLEDVEISEELEKQLRGRGIKIHTESTVKKFLPTQKEVHISGNAGESETTSADVVLVAVGIEPNSDFLNLPAAGVTTDNRGYIIVDETLATSVPHIYAVGDITGRAPLAHVAIAQAVTAAEAICEATPLPISAEQYLFMPRCTYGFPQVASMGYTETQLQEAGTPYNKGTVPLFPNGKAKAMGIQHGFIKILAGVDYGEILGAHMIGSGVTELLPAVSLAQLTELTPAEIARTVHAHPTLSEAVMDAAAAVEGQPLHL